MAAPEPTAKASQNVYLSPLDQYMPRLNISIYLIFPPLIAPTTDAINTLQSGLDKLAARLPYLRGSISSPNPDPSTTTLHRGRLSVTFSPATDKPITLVHVPDIVTNPDDDDEGVSFATLQSTHAPLDFFNTNPFPALLARRREASGWTEPGQESVMVACYALLADGGLVLGMAVHHGVADGTGVAELVRGWAACCAGEEESQEGRFPEADEVVRRGAMLKDALAACGVDGDGKEKGFDELLRGREEFRVVDGAGGAANMGNVPKGGSRAFGFDVGKLERAREMLVGKVEGRSLTVNNILCAVVWSLVTKARAARLGRGLLGKPSSKMGFAVNGRRVLGGEFAKRGYVGNVNLFGLTEVAVEELLGIGETCMAGTGGVEGLAPVIEQLAAATKRVTAQYIGEVVSMMDLAEDVRSVVPNWVRVYGQDLSVTSWANMDIYRDFGAALGRPALMRFPMAEGDGLVVVLPRRRTPDRSTEVVEMCIVLAMDDMEALEEDVVWRSWLVEKS